MGFLSAYEGTTKVSVGDPTRGYWVELREVLSQGARQRAEQELMGRQQVSGSDVMMKMDVVGYRQMMLLASIKDWNLDEDNGQVWPINLKSIQRLPGPIFDQLWSIIDASNAPRSVADQRQFRESGDAGGENGSGWTGELGPVLAEAAGVDQVGHEPGAAV